MNYALIGCGRIAANHINAALKNGLHITAVCDTVPEHMEALLKKYGLENDKRIDRCTDHREMMDRHPELEMAAIATPSGCHAAIALDCIDRGIPVVIEKPIAMSMADADEIIRRSREKNVTVCVCHQNRFNLAVQQVRRALEDGRFGRISHGSVHVRWSRDRDYYAQAPWRGTWSEDGGCLMNQCIHGIDLLRWMMGNEADTVYGVLRQRQHPYLEAEDIGMAVVTFKNGAVATIEGTTNVYPRNLEETICLFGETGTVRLGGKSANAVDVWEFEDRTEADAQACDLTENTPNVYGNGHVRLYADMIDAVRDRRRPYVDAQAGRDALELVLAIYKSAKTGQTVKLPLTDFSTLDMAGTFGPADA